MIPTQEEVCTNWWILLSAYWTGLGGWDILLFTALLRLHFPWRNIFSFVTADAIDTVSSPATSFCHFVWCSTFSRSLEVSLLLGWVYCIMYLQAYTHKVGLLVVSWLRDGSKTSTTFDACHNNSYLLYFTHSRTNPETIYYHQCLGTFLARVKKQCMMGQDKGTL